MSDRTTTADLPDPTDPDIDVVPGDPPVPITVWRPPAAATGMSDRLAARLLAAYSRDGDTVYDATADPAFARTAATAGRRTVTRAARGTGDLASLALAGWPPAGTIDPVITLGALRRRL